MLSGERVDPGVGGVFPGAGVWWGVSDSVGATVSHWAGAAVSDCTGATVWHCSGDFYNYNDIRGFMWLNNIINHTSSYRSHDLYNNNVIKDQSTLSISQIK